MGDQTLSAVIQAARLGDSEAIQFAQKYGIDYSKEPSSFGISGGTSNGNRPTSGTTTKPTSGTTTKHTSGGTTPAWVLPTSGTTTKPTSGKSSGTVNKTTGNKKTGGGSMS